MLAFSNQNGNAIAALTTVYQRKEKRVKGAKKGKERGKERGKEVRKEVGRGGGRKQGREGWKKENQSKKLNLMDRLFV